MPRAMAMATMKNKPSALSHALLPVLLSSLMMGLSACGGPDEEESFKGKRRPGAGRGDRGGRDSWGGRGRGAGRDSLPEDFSERPSPQAKRIDILFYIDRFDGDKALGACLQRFGQSVRDDGFLKHLGKKDWQVSFSLFSENPKLFAMEKDGYKVDKNQTGGFGYFMKTILILPLMLTHEPNYVLKRGRYAEEEEKDIFYETITPYRYADIHGFPLEPKQGRATPSRSNPYDAPRLSLSHRLNDDPLGGLNKLLKKNEHGFFRKKSKTFAVIMSASPFPHYTPEEWSGFLSGKKTHFIFLLSRRSASRPLAAALSERQNAELRLFCESAAEAPDLARHIFQRAGG